MKPTPEPRNMANAESTLEMKLKQLKRTEDKASNVLKTEAGSNLRYQDT